MEESLSRSSGLSMKNHNYFVYIMASETGTLYSGVTNNLERRVSEHQQGLVDGYTKKYGCTRLVYYEHYQDIRDAIARETQLKKWNRIKKENLIKTVNPRWDDLSEEWV